MKVKKNKKTEKGIQTGYRPEIWVGIIIIITFIVYSTGFKNNFTNWDDPGYITQNELIKDFSFSGIVKLFTRDGFYGGNYHPLTALSNMLELHFFGMKPPIFHFFNLLFHLFNIFFVYKLLQKFKLSSFVIISVVGVFAMHPTRIESVVWMAERKDVLFSFFFIPALIHYINFRQTDKIKYIIYTFVLFVAALLSKSAAVTLPLLFPVVDWYLKKLKPAGLVVYLPFLALSVITGLVALESQSTTMVDFTTPVFSWSEKPWIASYALARYIILSVLPFPLAPLHPFPLPGQLDFWYYISPLLIIAILFSVYKSNQKPILVFAILFFIITNLLTLQILPVGKAIIAERYTYLPYIGWFVFIFIWVEEIFKKNSSLSWVSGVFITFLVIITWVRIPVWKDSASLWKDQIEKYPNHWYGYFSIAQAGILTPPQAVPMLEKSVQLFPNPDAYNNLSELYAMLNRLPEALAAADSALTYNPQHIQANNNRGVTLDKMGRYDEAFEQYEKAHKMRPDNELIVYNQGNVRLSQHRYQEAIELFYKSNNIKPNNTAQYHIGYAYAQMEMRDSACYWFRISMTSGNAMGAEAYQKVCGGK